MFHHWTVGVGEKTITRAKKSHLKRDGFFGTILEQQCAIAALVFNYPLALRRDANPRPNSPIPKRAMIEGSGTLERLA